MKFDRTNEVVFEGDAEWNFDRRGIMFWALAGSDHVRCIVAAEAVADSFGGPATKENCLDRFAENRASIEAEAEALIRSGRLQEMPNETFLEAAILATRIRHRPGSSSRRRVTAEEFAGSGVAEHAANVQWWSDVSKVARERILVASNANGVLYVDIAFPSEALAATFDYKMSKLGVRPYRIAPSSAV